MAGHLLFNSGSNETSLAPQFKWLDNTFNFTVFLLINFRVHIQFSDSSQLLFSISKFISIKRTNLFRFVIKIFKICIYYYIQHCFIELRTVATLALSIRRQNHSARSHPKYSARFHPQTRLDIIHNSVISHPHSTRSHPLFGQISSTNRIDLIQYFLTIHRNTYFHTQGLFSLNH